MKERIIEVDIIKALGIVGVVLIHLLARGLFAYEIGSFNWIFLIFLGSIIRASVPLFFMASGQLMFNPNRQMDTAKFLKKYMPRLIIALFVWAGSYGVFKLILRYIYTGSLEKTLIYGMIKDLLTFQHNGQLYFLHIIILFYLFIPCIRVYLSSAKKRDIEYLLILWFILGIVYPTLRAFQPFKSLTGIPAQYAINMTYSSLGYGLLGYYIGEYIESIRIKGKYIMILSAIAIFLTTLSLSMARGENVFTFWEGMSPFVALLAGGIYLYVFQTSRGKKNYPLIVELSKSSFTIFLVHDFFNIILDTRGVTAATSNPIIFLPIAGAFIIIASYLIYLFLSQFKIAKKYLI